MQINYMESQQNDYDYEDEDEYDYEDKSKIQERVNDSKEKEDEDDSKEKEDEDDSKEKEDEDEYHYEDKSKIQERVNGYCKRNKFCTKIEDEIESQKQQEINDKTRWILRLYNSVKDLDSITPLFIQEMRKREEKMARQYIISALKENECILKDDAMNKQQEFEGNLDNNKIICIDNTYQFVAK